MRRTCRPLLSVMFCLLLVTGFATADVTYTEYYVSQAEGSDVTGEGEILPKNWTGV